MRLITDTNILVRCVRGRAFHRVDMLIADGAELLVTSHTVEELFNVLVRKVGMDPDAALMRGTRILRPFEVAGSDSYIDLKAVAERRLRQGGKNDWPVLAAAIAFDCAIWSEDTDFFGTGVAVWSTHNVLDSTSSEKRVSDA